MDLDLELKDRGISSKHTEGNKCTCANEVEHQLLVESVDASFLQDAERRKYAPTSESMRFRVLEQLAKKQLLRKQLGWS